MSAIDNIKNKNPEDTYYQKGNLIYRRGTKCRVRLIKCPICDKEFAYKGGSQRRKHYLYDHTPSDFDL